MKGKRKFNNVSDELKQELLKDYSRLILKERIKSGLVSMGKVSSQVLLLSGVLSGVILLMAVSPNIFAAIGRVANKQKRVFLKCDEKDFNRALIYLKNRGYIKIGLNENGFSVKLTNKGLSRSSYAAWRNLKIHQQKRWDGLWRLVMFDIPEKNKQAREALRQKLNLMGFYQLQKSVFVTPYECRKEIYFLKEIFNIKDDILLVVAKSFDGEDVVNKHFELS